MSKKFQYFKKNINFRKRRYKRKFLSSKYKSLIILFLSTVFIGVYLIRKSHNKIHIAMNMDNGYIYSCIVFLTSLLNNRAKSTFYIFHILTNNQTSQESMNKIKSIIKKFGNNRAKVIFYNLKEDFEGVPINGYPLTVYYRIATPSLLSNVDKIIYSDLDMLNFKDLSELYNTKFKKDMYICAVLDDFYWKKELKKVGIEINKYVNSGILLMDLKSMRENSIEKKLRDFIATNNLLWPDQTAINAICRDNIQIISYKYNLYAWSSYSRFVNINNGQIPMYRVNISELYQAYHEPTNAHFLGNFKPWNRERDSLYKNYWWYFAKKSGFYNEILKYYKYDINYAESLINTIPEDGGLLKGNYKKFSS